MATRVKVEGLRELDKALGKFEPVTAKAVGRRVLKKAAKPIETAARSVAPEADGHLRDSIATSTKLNKRQKKLARREGKSGVEVYVGTNDPAGIQQEFGNINHGAQAFMRPAWDGNKRGALKIIKDELGNEIDRTAARLRKKALKGK